MNKQLYPWEALAAISLIFGMLICAPLRKDIPFVPRQEQFCLNVAKLILFINVSGYKCTFGETLRTKEQAQENAKNKIGIVDSNHLYKLAVDLNLFDKDGKYIVDSKQYKQFADYWLTLNKNNEAGYFWKSVDANHFEMD
jgi:hypothetical protein